MFKNLSEQEILEYLMTSDFNEGLTPDEFRLLLFQFRNFFRIISGKNELLKTEFIGREQKFQEMCKSFEKKIEDLQIQKADVENKLMFNSTRKLTLKERWTGKLINQYETK